MPGYPVVKMCHCAGGKSQLIRLLYSICGVQKAESWVKRLFRYVSRNSVVVKLACLLVLKVGNVCQLLNVYSKETGAAFYKNNRAVSQLYIFTLSCRTDGRP